MVNDLPANAGDTGESGLIPGSGRCPGGGNGNSLQCSCLGNSRTEESGGLQCTGSQSDMNEHTCTRAEKVLKVLNEVFPPVITDKLQRATFKLREKDRQRRKQRATGDLRTRYLKAWVWLLACGADETNREEASLVFEKRVLPKKPQTWTEGAFDCRS